MSDLIAQITARYEAEHAAPPEPVTRAAILPSAFEMITDEWLTDALCSAAPGAAVTGHRLGPPDNGTSNRRKIDIEYNEAGRAAGLPEKLFCKATHDLANRITLGLASAAFCEVSFYNTIRPALNIEAPHSFYANIDETSYNSLIILEDISDRVLEFCTHATAMTLARAQSQMALLAHFHGRGYRDRTLQKAIGAHPDWPQFFENTLAFGMKEGSEAGFQKSNYLMPKRLFARADEIWPATLSSVDRQKVLPKTVCHGDVHLKNWYVRQGGAMGLSDWQCTHFGHWSRDVAYTIATALTVEDRRQWERGLLKFYIEALAKAGGPAVSFDEALLNYRQQLVTALTWWTITINPAPDMTKDMQPIDVTEAFIHRITTAMDDNDTLDSYE